MTVVGLQTPIPSESRSHSSYQDFSAGFLLSTRRQEGIFVIVRLAADEDLYGPLKRTANLAASLQNRAYPHCQLDLPLPQALDNLTFVRSTEGFTVIKISINKEKKGHQPDPLDLLQIRGKKHTFPRLQFSVAWRQQDQEEAV